MKIFSTLVETKCQSTLPALSAVLIANLLLISRCLPLFCNEVVKPIRQQSG